MLKESLEIEMNYRNLGWIHLKMQESIPSCLGL